MARRVDRDALVAMLHSTLIGTSGAELKPARQIASSFSIQISTGWPERAVRWTVR